MDEGDLARDEARGRANLVFIIRGAIRRRASTLTPFVVADKIVEIVQSKTWKLRHTVGPDAEPTLQYRASMTDEQWVDLQSVESDQEWLANVKRDFGVDVELL